MYIARRMTDYSLQEIGGFFGGRDHTTVMYADDKISTLIKQDPKIRATITEVKTLLLKPPG